MVQEVTITSSPETAPLVEGFLTSGTNRGLSKHTLRWYSGILLPFAGKYPVLPDRPELVEGYIGSYQTGDERRHGVYRVLRAFYNFTSDRRGLNNPMDTIRPPRVRPNEKPALTLAQLRHLLEYPGHSHMMRALLYLLADTAARLGDVATLTGNDILPDGVKLSKGKTGSRIVPVSPQVRDLLTEVIPASTSLDQRLFPYSVWWLSRLITRAMKAAGLVGFSCHSLRHSFCTLWQGSDTALKQITGHHSWQMIEHYKHQKEAQAAAQHQQYSPVALLNGPPIHHNSGERADANLETIVQLAQELGAAKERIKYLESQLSRQN